MAMMKLIILLSLQFFCITIHDPNRVEFKSPPSNLSNWESFFENNNQIKDFKILITGKVEVPIEGMLNLKSVRLPKDLKWDKTIFVDVFAFRFCHSKKGCFLIDSGLDSSFQSGGNISGLFAKDYIISSKQNKGENILSKINKYHEKIQGVFLTHLHGDHTSGIPELPKNIEYYVGKGETYINYKYIYYSNHLNEINEIYELNPNMGINMPYLDKVIDIFGDGSFLAIPSMGHSNSHLSYLLSTKLGVFLLLGDVSHTWKGWEWEVEPGWMVDRNKGIESLKRLKEFSLKYPQVIVIPGHDLPPNRKLPIE
jgi:N-acyl homoserine lactone hydrolase